MAGDFDEGHPDSALNVGVWATIALGVDAWYKAAPSLSLIQADVYDVHAGHVDGTVQVDATVNYIVSENPQADAILAEIHQKCSALNAESFQNIGKLEQYRPLMEKAQEVNDATRILSAGLEGVSMDEVTQLATQIGQVLESMTYTLRSSTTIDDEQVLTRIRNFVGSFSALQEHLEKFQLQVASTKTILIPKSLELAHDHLVECQGTVEQVMESMKYFSGVTTVDPGNTQMSDARQNEITAAITALETINSLGDTVLTGFQDQTTNAIKGTVDAINDNTKTDLALILAKLNEFPMAAHWSSSQTDAS